MLTLSMWCLVRWYLNFANIWNFVYKRKMNSDVIWWNYHLFGIYTSCKLSAKHLSLRLFLTFLNMLAFLINWGCYGTSGCCANIFVTVLVELNSCDPSKALSLYSFVEREIGEGRRDQKNQSRTFAAAG